MSSHRLPAALAAVLLFVSPAAPGKGPSSRWISALPTPISAVQGDGTVSPVAGTTVTVEGVVTARIATGFFVQSLPGTEDADPATSEGLYVHTGVAPDGQATVGHRLSVTGQVEEFTPAANPNQLPVTRLLPVAITLLGTGQPLPPYAVIPAAAVAADADIDGLERYEGMRVDFPQGLRVVGPTGSTGDEVLARYSSTGVFHAVNGYGPQPFREPGLPLLAAAEPPAGKSIPIYDNNPERIRVDSAAQPGAWRLSAGVDSVIGGTMGVLHYAEAAYTLMPDAWPGLTYGSGSAGVAADPLPARQLRLAWIDMDRLFDSQDDPALDEPVPTAGVYAARVAKAAQNLCVFASTPDVLAVYGVETAQVLADVKAAIAVEPSYCPGHPSYEMVHADGGADGLDLGFLVGTRSATADRPGVQVVEHASFGIGATFAAPDSTPLPIFDQAPLRVRVRFSPLVGDPFEVDVVNVQLNGRDQLGRTDPGSHGWATVADRARAQRAAQAVYLAQWLQAWQDAAPDRALAVLGGFDAHEFSDGQVDVLGLLTGQQAPADQVWLPMANPLTRPLQNLTLRAQPTERYSAIVDGIAEAPDHVLVNAALLERFSVRTQHPHGISVNPRTNSETPMAPAYYGVRDPVVADLAERSLSQADGALTGISTPPKLSPHNYNELGFLLDNLGPDTAPHFTLALESNLPADAWRLYIGDPVWRCDAPSARAGGGSRMQCSLTEMAANDAKFVKIEIPANPALQGVEARFDISVSGGYTDPQPANDTLAIVTRFEGNSDLAVTVTPGGEVIPTDNAIFSVVVENPTYNDPGTATLVVTLDAPTTDIRFWDTSSSLNVVCSGADLSAVSSRWVCTRDPQGSPDVMRLTFQLKTALLDGGRRIGAQAVVTSSKTDTDPSNNQASAELVVSDRSDLSVVPHEDSAEYFNLDSESRIGFTVDSPGLGVAREAVLQLDVGVTPDRIAGIHIFRNRGVIMEWRCDDARDGAPGRSLITCRSDRPLIDTEVHPVSWYFLVRINAPLVPGQATSTITGNATVSTASEDRNPADNSTSKQIVIDQTTDFVVRDITDANAHVLEPTPALYPFRLLHEGRNQPREGGMHVEVQAVVDPDRVVVTDGSSGNRLACSPVTAAAGRTRLRCVTPGTIQAADSFTSTRVSVTVPTRPDLYGLLMPVTLTVDNLLVEMDASDNTATGTVRVDADADLCASYSRGACHQVDVPIAKVAAGSRTTLPLRLRNTGPSTAVGTRATIQLPLPSAQVSATVAGGTCDAAVASGNGSRIVCHAGDLDSGDPVARVVMLTLDSTGKVAGERIPVQFSVASDRPDSYAGNNTVDIDVPVVPAVDLRARISTKVNGRGAGASLEFHLDTSVASGNTAEPSWLHVGITAPVTVTAPQVISVGWQCYGASGPGGGALTCYRSGAIPSGGNDRLVLRFRSPGFLGFGESIRVDASHVFHENTLAADPSLDNARASAEMVPGGRETTARPTPLRPVAAARAPEARGTYAPARSRNVPIEVER